MTRERRGEEVLVAYGWATCWPTTELRVPGTRRFRAISGPLSPAGVSCVSFVSRRFPPACNSLKTRGRAFATQSSPEKQVDKKCQPAGVLLTYWKQMGWRVSEARLTLFVTISRFEAPKKLPEEGARGWCVSFRAQRGIWHGVFCRSSLATCHLSLVTVLDPVELVAGSLPRRQQRLVASGVDAAGLAIADIPQCGTYAPPAIPRHSRVACSRVGGKRESTTMTIAPGFPLSRE
jgi:hypothetical protein